MTNQKKLLSVKEIIDNLRVNKNFLLAKFDKIPHQALESLRKNLKKDNYKIKIVKNTLFEKAINKLINVDKLFLQFKKNFLPLKNNTALILFGDEWSKGLKTIYEFISKNKEKNLSFKFAFLDGQIYDSEKTEKIAQLPSKDILITKLISSMKSPTSHLIYALKFNSSKLVYILKQKSQQ